MYYGYIVWTVGCSLFVCCGSSQPTVKGSLILNFSAAKEINYDEKECRWNIGRSRRTSMEVGGCRRKSAEWQSEEKEWQHSSLNEEMLIG